MDFQRSSQLTFITLVILLLHPYFTTAGFTPTSIQNIRTDGVVDLYVMYNGNGGILEPSATEILWDYYDATGPIGLAYSTFDESVELIAGPAEAAGNDVVDIAVTHLSTSVLEYWYPASIPLGLYHLRINSTANTTMETTVIQNFSVRSMTINVTSSEPFGCGLKVPAPFTNVTSPSSPEFTSVVITLPFPGQNIVEYSWQDTTLKNFTNIAWDYRDARNTNGAGISNVTAQFQDSTTGSAIGPVLTPLVISPVGPNSGISVDLNDVPVKIGGSYKLLFSYRNNIQDGAVIPGNIISFTTEEFNVVLFEDNECANVTAGSGSSNTGSSGGPSGGSSGESSGGGRVLPEITFIVTVLATMSLVLS